MGEVLILAGVSGLIVGAIAAFKGSPGGPVPLRRKQAALLMAAGLIAVLAGAAMGGPVSSRAPQNPTPISKPPAARPQGAAALRVPVPGGKRPATVPAGAQEATVTRNVDGDTIWAKGGTLPAAAESKIRLLEINTPESTTRTECFGPEASAFAKAQLGVGSKIYLLADREDKDQYGRFLRYIWKADGEFFNEKAVLEGYAKAVLYPPNDAYIALMRQAEARARAAGKGLWSACAGQAAGAPAAAPAPVRSVAPAGARCDAAYPDFCIPPPPPDLACAQVPGRRFTVLPPDPHGFDRDKNQIGCESG